MNKIAGLCCGSCRYFECREDWYACYLEYDQVLDDDLSDWEQDNPKNADETCLCYTPRNPIPPISVPGVKEMVMEAFRKGLSYTHYDSESINAETKEYMKALEAGYERD